MILEFNAPSLRRIRDVKPKWDAAVGLNEHHPPSLEDRLLSGEYNYSRPPRSCSGPTALEPLHLSATHASLLESASVGTQALKQFAASSRNACWPTGKFRSGIQFS